jgi:ABC-type Fe3+ transport system substrate-binding protein
MMRRIKAIIGATVLAAGLMFQSVPASAADQAMIDEAKKEGALTWYTTLIINQAVRPMVAAFEKKYPGIKVSFSRATNSDTALKVINEAKAGRVEGDVFDGALSLLPLLKAGLVAPYKSPSADAYPPEMKDEDGYWTTTHLYFLTTSYNTSMVPADQAPKTYQELLDPKWKGNIAWTNDLTPNGPPGFIYNILTTMGEEKGLDYLRKLAEQQPVSIPASQRVVLDRVIAGEYPLGIMTFNHHDAISSAKGAPVDWIKMEPLVATTSSIGIVKNAPHPNAARLFVDFMLSEEGQQVLSDAFYLPARPGAKAKVPELMPAVGNFKVTNIGPTKVAEGLDKWIAIYNELFR